MGYATEQVVAIKSLISAKRARLYVSKNEIPVKRMTERLLRNESLAQYQYFTDIERSENEDGGAEAARVKFWGPDVLNGKVHSNDDIWIQQLGGGNNNNWPTFYDQVTTAGIFRKYPTGIRLEDSGAPMNLIFRGPEPAWQEEVPSIIFEPNAEEIRLHGERPFGDPNMDIAYVTIEGTAYTSMVANIQLDEIKEFTVYSWYPADADQANAVIDIGGNWFEDADSLWVNHIPIYDTIWTTGPSGVVNNGSVFVECELWIEGEIIGKQTWGCEDTIYIVGDITYQGTTPGAPPDDPDDLNTRDYFGLVSEKKLMVRYKHIDPETGELMAPNCNSLYMYGAYAAIGKGDEVLYGDMACHHDGIFTFQYHHPHGSTPNFEAPSPYISAEFTIILFDAGGDGWDDSSLDVIVEGEIVLDDITCYASANTYTFTVNNGDIIETEYTPSGYANENEHTYEIYDQYGDLVASDGPSPGPGVMFQVFLPPEQDTLYTYIDFHKFIYPINDYVQPNIQDFNLHGAPPPDGYPCGYDFEHPGYIYSYPNSSGGNPYYNYAIPYGTDWPWYNPVWPENRLDIVYERGTLHIYGAIAQRRRGFVHRSGQDPYNHPDPPLEPIQLWDIDEYHYDGRHPSTGYAKDYYYDQRFLFVQPPDYPQIYTGWGTNTLQSFNEETWYFKTPRE
jgi:hypothetical protein